MFLSPLPHVPLPFTKINVLHYDLKKDAINEFWIKYWTSNPVWVTFQEHGSSFYVNIEEKVWLLVKKIRTDRVTKTSLFDRNWAISLKPRRKSRPLHLVWWTLLYNWNIVESNMQHVGGILQVLCFPPPIKLTTTI